MPCVELHEDSIAGIIGDVQGLQWSGGKKGRVGYALSGEDYKWLRTNGSFSTREWIIRLGF